MDTQTKRKRRYLPGTERKVIWDKFNKLCCICGCETVLFKSCRGNIYSDDYKEVAHIDHIIPFSQGGKCEHSNFRLLCEHCNTSRGGQL